MSARRRPLWAVDKSTMDSLLNLSQTPRSTLMAR